MSKLNEIRLRNFRKLAGEFGSKTEFSVETGIHASYISQILGGYRNIGEKLARKIESNTGKPPMWLDHEEVLSEVHIEVIRRLEKLPEQNLPVIAAFLDSLDLINQKNQ